eukprot:Skav200204  [mRNA]  locus=scaffold623:512826:515837:- [translate_table: standard]
MSIQCLFRDQMHPLTCKPITSLFEFVQSLGIESPDCQKIKCMVNKVSVSWNETMQNIINGRLSLHFKDCEIFSCLVERVPTIGISPPLLNIDCDDDEELLDNALIQFFKEHDVGKRSINMKVKVCVMGTDVHHQLEWPKDITDSQITLRLAYMLLEPNAQPDVTWFEVPMAADDHFDMYIIVDPQGLYNDELSTVMFRDRNEDVKAIQCPKTLCPWNFLERSAAVNFHLNGEKENGNIECENGDFIECVTKKRPAEDVMPLSDFVRNRLELTKLNEGKLGTDEMQFATNVIRTLTNDFRIADFVISHDETIPLIYKESIHQLLDRVVSCKSTEFLPILAKSHWALIKFQWENGGIVATFSNMSSEFSNHWARFLSFAAVLINIPISLKSKILHANRDMCGWAIIHDWVSLLLSQESNQRSIANSIFNAEVIAMLEDDHCSEAMPCVQIILRSFFLGKHHIPELRNLTSVVSTAFWFRQSFFRSESSEELSSIEFGGTGNQDETKDAKMDKEDPWALQDPWVVPNAAKKKQCRWEDLQVPEDHCFYTQDKQRIPQCHRFQLSSNVGGISFCTRSMVPLIVNSKPKKPFALLLPVSEGLRFEDDLNLSISKPVEAVVRDSSTQEVYKRQMLLVQQGNEVMHMLTGLGDLLTRDFLEKGQDAAQRDCTILPRFWPSDHQGKEQALKLGSGAKGYAGIVLVRRGLAIRALCSDLTDIRRVILANDERITDVNRHIVPRITLETRGWPFSIDPTQVISAIKAATGLICIPCRCYKSLGVTTWTIALEKMPDKRRFCASFSGELVEILITEPLQPASLSQKTQKPSKGKGKGKNKAAPSEPPSSSSHKDVDIQSQRLTVLESKMSSVEKRQDVIENKLNDGFQKVNDQLRQLLQAINPKQASHSSTGMTPPPKAAKTS